MAVENKGPAAAGLRMNQKMNAKVFDRPNYTLRINALAKKNDNSTKSARRSPEMGCLICFQREHSRTREYTLKAKMAVMV